jgi:hypothetical protein
LFDVFNELYCCIRLCSTSSTSLKVFKYTIDGSVGVGMMFRREDDMEVIAVVEAVEVGGC